MTADEILSRIAEALDPDEIVDRLGLTSEQLVHDLEDRILDNKTAFYDILEVQDD